MKRVAEEQIFEIAIILVKNTLRLVFDEMLLVRCGKRSTWKLKSLRLSYRSTANVPLSETEMARSGTLAEVLLLLTFFRLRESG